MSEWSVHGHLYYIHDTSTALVIQDFAIKHLVIIVKYLIFLALHYCWYIAVYVRIVSYLYYVLLLTTV